MLIITVKVKGGIEALENAGKEVGLKINGDKTKLLIQTKKNRGKIDAITIGNNTIDRVDKFKYLGVILTDRNEEMAEVQNRIKNANKVYYAILPLIKDRDINRKSRLI